MKKWFEQAIQQGPIFERQMACVTVILRFYHDFMCKIFLVHYRAKCKRDADLSSKRMSGRKKN